MCWCASCPGLFNENDGTDDILLSFYVNREFAMTQTRIDIAKKGLKLGVHIGVNFYKVHKSEKTRKEIDIFRCWFDAQ